MKNDIIEGVVTEHSHPPSTARLIAIKTVDGIKKRASSSDECTSSVIQKETTQFPLDAAADLPNKEVLSRMVRRKRTAPDGNIITEELKVTTRGEPFLAHEDENLEIVILTTPKNLDVLESKLHLFCDGTFDSAPHGFQLYTNHAMLTQSRTVPLVFCVTKQKNEVTYDAIWTFLKNKRNLNPALLMLDFEKAAMNSVKRHFPHSQISGCLFHFGQSVWRKIQAQGLASWYTQSPENAMLIKSLQALAFVPLQDVSDTFEQLVSSLDEETDIILGDFLTYFEATWIGNVQRGRRRLPVFHQELWNVHERVLQDLPRTNNSIEG